MLIYETEGFLEVEAKSIKQLCRSTAAVPLEDSEDETYAVYAVLCDYLDKSEQRCRVAFYSKVMKRALIFAVRGSDKQSSWKHGQEVLAQLGFRLEDVNLKLSPAMLEVVLRDVPGLISPADARKQRTEKAQLLTELQETFDKAPGSAKGKKAALKLSAKNAQIIDPKNYVKFWRDYSCQKKLPGQTLRRSLAKSMTRMQGWALPRLLPNQNAING